jgi:hypothetical protein
MPASGEGSSSRKTRPASGADPSSHPGARRSPDLCGARGSSLRGTISPGSVGYKPRRDTSRHWAPGTQRRRSRSASGTPRRTTPPPPLAAARQRDSPSASAVGRTPARSEASWSSRPPAPAGPPGIPAASLLDHRSARGGSVGGGTLSRSLDANALYTRRPRTRESIRAAQAWATFGESDADHASPREHHVRRGGKGLLPFPLRLE